MNLYFKNSNGEESLVCSCKNEKEAIKQIRKFCEDRAFRIFYQRSWKDKNGDTVYDVGSHTEFFILKRF